MKHTRKKTNGTKRHMLLLPVFLVAVVALILGAAAPELWAKSRNNWAKSRNHWDNGWNHRDNDDEDAIPFEDAKIIIEVNATDRDAGVQVFIDGEAWKELEIESPNGREILELEAKRKLKKQGLTEFFFESAEPSFDDQSLEDFLKRFPEGEYEFEGETVEGQELESTAEFSHVMPCGPVVVEPTEVVPTNPDDTIIIWIPVEDVIDPAATDDADEGVVCEEPEEELDIEGYQVIVEGDAGDFDITLPATATSVQVPPELLEPGETYKFEVLAIAENGNQTITESEFTTTGP